MEVDLTDENYTWSTCVALIVVTVDNAQLKQMCVCVCRVGVCGGIDMSGIEEHVQIHIDRKWYLSLLISCDRHKLLRYAYTIIHPPPAQQDA